MHKIEDEIFNIAGVQIRVLQPTKTVNPFQDATMGPFQNFGIAILTLEDENGIVGESTVYHSYNNILETCLLPILFHSKNMPYSSLYHQLYWSIRNEGFRGAAAALLGQVDLALHDMAARRHGLPLYKYLGASRNWVKMYGSGGGVNYSLKELETEVAVFLIAGVDCYKMKVGKDFGTKMKEDVERVKFVRSLLGKNIRLAVDANQIWDCKQALQFIDLAGNADLAWFEEPVHSAALDQIEQLCKSTHLKISFGESERSGLVFPSLVNAGVGHLQPIPNQIGGVAEWMQVRDLAASKQLAFSAGGYSLFTTSLIATAAEECQVEYLYPLMAGLEDYFCVRPEWKNGMFVLPEIEGLSIRIDWDYCNQNNLVINKQSWRNHNVKEYRPLVSM